MVLAGGRGSRMGGVDKGLQLFKGQPLVQHAVQRLLAQSGGAPGFVAINANRNLDEYASFGDAYWTDSSDDFPGPLAGFQTALNHMAVLAQAGRKFEYLLTVPCDSPLYPLDLLLRLRTALEAQNAEVAVAVGAETFPDGRAVLRAQPVFSLIKPALQSSLQNYLQSGERKIDAWLGQHRLARVAFDLPHDDIYAFANANTLEELHTLERL